MPAPLNMMWLDVETTGLNRGKCGIASVAALANWDTEGGFYTEVRVPDGLQLDDAALRINGFTAETLRDPNKPDELTVCNMLNQWMLSKFSGAPFLCGMNVQFDVDFVNAMYRRAGAVMGLKTRNIDIQAMATLLHDAGLIELPRAGDAILTNLDRLIEIFLPGAQRNSAIHNAYEDIWLTRNVYWAMRKMLTEHHQLAKAARVGV